MKRLYIISIIILLAIGNSIGQVENEIPHLETNPDHFIQTEKIIDSIIQYAYTTPGDSTLLHKWDYISKENNLHESVRHFWRSDLGDWSGPRNKYVFQFDNDWNLLLIEHYPYIYSRGVWKGCDSHGCGKKEWAYDDMGNQILWRQSYWNSVQRRWVMDDEWEKEYKYDSYGNLVLKSHRYKDEYNRNREWDGEKDEYSYDINGNKTGHVKYRWNGRDPYDWMPLNKAEWHYNSFDQLESLANYQWESGRWIGYFDDWNKCFRAENLYDSEGKITSVNLYTWNHEKDNWVLYYSEPVLRNSNGQVISGLEFTFFDYDFAVDIVVQRNEFTYNTNGHLIGQVKNSYKEWLASWPNPSRVDTILFNSEGLIISEISCYWEMNFGGGLSLTSSKYEYDYDNMGNKVLQLEYNWDTNTGTWEESNKDLWVYNEIGNLVLQLGYNRDKNTGTWEENYKYLWEYNENGNMILQLEYNWDENTGTWEENYKELWEYNENGNMIRHAVFNWDPELNNWGGSRKEEYDFDDQGNRIMFAQFNWDSDINNWIGSEKEVLDFDEQGNEILYVSFGWNTETNDWVYSSKNTNQFDSSGNNISERTFVWNTERNDWDGITRRDHEFDDNGHLTMFASYGWDYDLSDWRGEDEKMSWKYSPEGKLKGESSCVWDTIQNGWQNKIWLDLILDDDGDPLSFSQCSWNPNNNEWEPVIKNYYYYNNSATSKEDIEVNHINLFPNPSSDIINITGLTEPANIKIYNLQGQLLKSERQITSSIDITDINSGIYFIKILAGDKEIVKKVVKE